MPDKMSPEKMNLLTAIGCKVVVCPTEVQPDDPQSYYSVSRKIAETTENSFYANQYFNPANPIAHYNSTGPEIWKQTDGKLTHFVCGVGTGGTISGTARYLKEQNPQIKIIGIDPLGSILAHYHQYRNTDIVAKSYKIEGVGEDIIPDNVHFDLIDDMITVNDLEAMLWTRKIAREEGILLGSSSGMVAAGVEKLIEKFHKENSFIVALFPDTGERYLGKVYSDAWMRSNKFLAPAKSITEILESKSANLPSVILLSSNQTITEARMKFEKFGVQQIIIKFDADRYKTFSRNYLNKLILSSIDDTLTLDQLELDEINTIAISTTLDELRKILVNEYCVLIEDNSEIKGFINRQDLINNYQV